MTQAPPRDERAPSRGGVIQTGSLAVVLVVLFAIVHNYGFLAMAAGMATWCHAGLVRATTDTRRYLGWALWVVGAVLVAIPTLRLHA
ncbi:MAG: hypothetical protein LC798_11795 [Chloroflexi bacterium]|nr:hypothetical protein [Chloroflexota bacterium]